MASIRKRSSWRVVVDRHTANAAVLNTLEQAAAAARELVAQGVAFGLVRASRKGLALGAGTARVERVPGGSWDRHCL